MAMDGIGWGACFYFILLIVFGAMFVLNLFLAIICDNFHDPERSASAAPAVNASGLGGKGRSKQQIAAAELHDARAKRLRGLIESTACSRFINAIILLNTLIMCCYYYEMPAALSRALDDANAALSLVFAVEMGAKLYAYGLRGYVADTYNQFDAVVVLSSLVELALVYLPLVSSTGVNVSVLRALRLFRVLKLARSYKGLRKVLVMMLDSLVELNSLFILMSLIMFVFALLGEQLFGLQLSAANGFESVPRTNFDSMAQALITARAAWLALHASRLAARALAPRLRSLPCAPSKHTLSDGTCARPRGAGLRRHVWRELERGLPGLLQVRALRVRALLHRAGRRGQLRAAQPHHRHPAQLDRPRPRR